MHVDNSGLVITISHFIHYGQLITYHTLLAKKYPVDQF